MKIVILIQERNEMQVIARNKKTAINEIQRIYNNSYKFIPVITQANNFSGELGLYKFIYEE